MVKPKWERGEIGIRHRDWNEGGVEKIEDYSKKVTSTKTKYRCVSGE